MISIHTYEFLMSMSVAIVVKIKPHSTSTTALNLSAIKLQQLQHISHIVVIVQDFLCPQNYSNYSYKYINLALYKGEINFLIFFQLQITFHHVGMCRIRILSSGNMSPFGFIRYPVNFCRTLTRQWENFYYVYQKNTQYIFSPETEIGVLILVILSWGLRSK